jgi:hypothetical protein
LDRLTKSFAAGHQGLSNAGRTGVSALTKDHLDPVIKSIALEESRFLLTKDMSTEKLSNTVYNYIVKTEVGTDQDLAGFESFLPQEQAAQYLRAAEIVKTYGVRKSITQLAQFQNEAGGFAVDIDDENDKNAGLSMTTSMERDLYQGMDDYIDPVTGEVDALISSRWSGAVRHARGIQANVVEGDQSQRGIPGDFLQYGNNRSVVHDKKGQAMDREWVDEVVTSVNDNQGAISEAHCTTSMLQVFRATFFPTERGDVGQAYNINGANVKNDEKMAWPLMTVSGTVSFVSSVFKYRDSTPRLVVASSGQSPITPTITSITASASVTGSEFEEGQAFSYKVQAVNISGRSAPATASYTVGGGDADKANQITIAAQAGVEHFMIFRSPLAQNGKAGTERYCGKVLANRAGATIFVDKDTLMPGLDPILFLPSDKARFRLGTVGNLLNKLPLGVQGTGFETIYTSYWCCIVDQPRTFAVGRNVKQKISGL